MRNRSITSSFRLLKIPYGSKQQNENILNSGIIFFHTEMKTSKTLFIFRDPNGIHTI